MLSFKYCFSFQHKQGIESFGQTGERYVGMYSNDTRNGQGTAYYSDGSTKYLGDWRDGSPGNLKQRSRKKNNN